MRYWPIALSPNASFRDSLLALKLLLSPWQWRDGAALAKVGDWFKTELGATHVYLLNSGRAALFVLLKALDLRPGDEVIMQAFTCLAVPTPVLWAGGRPVYVDIDPATLNMSLEGLKAAINTRTKTIIVQHTFGNPAPLNEILALAKSKGIVVIEDCAHALGVRLSDGARAGTQGQAAFFSFGRDKVASSVFGGALVVNDPQLVPRVSAVMAKISKPRHSWVTQQLMHPILTVPLASMVLPGTGPVLKLLEFLKILSKAIVTKEYGGQKPDYWPALYPNALARLLLPQLAGLNEIQAHRTQIAGVYRQILPRAALIKTDHSTVPWLRFPVKVKQNALVLRAARRGVLPIGDWYTCPVAPMRTNLTAVEYTPGLCPNVEKAALTIVNLPTHRHVTESAARALAQWLLPYV